MNGAAELARGDPGHPEDGIHPAAGARQADRLGNTHELVVLAARGQQPRGGAEIRVAGAPYSDDRLTIDVVDVIPAPSCLTTAALTQPVDAVALPRREITVWSFRERKETRRC